MAAYASRYNSLADIDVEWGEQVRSFNWEPALVNTLRLLDDPYAEAWIVYADFNDFIGGRGRWRK